MPAYVPARSGGIARSARTATLGTKKNRSPLILGPSHRATANRRPSVGTARAELARVTSHRARPVCPTHSPIGTAMAAEIAIVSTV